MYYNGNKYIEGDYYFMGHTSQTGFEIFKITQQKLKGKFTKAFVGALAYLAPMALLCCIPYVGWALAVLAFGYLTVGYITYMKQLLNNEDVKLFTIYEWNKNFATVTFLGAVYLLLVLLGYIVFIIPGIIIVAFYSNALHVSESEKSTSVLETFRKSANLVEGKKVFLLSYKVIYYFFYALSVLLFGVLMLFNERLFGSMPVLAVALLIFIGVVFFLLFAIITASFFASNQIFYEGLTKKPVQPAEQKPEEIVVEQPKQEPEKQNEIKVEKPAKEVVKQPAKKPAAKKPATKPTAASAKKPAAKKPTTETK